MPGLSNIAKDKMGCENGGWHDNNRKEIAQCAHPMSWLALNTYKVHQLNTTLNMKKVYQMYGMKFCTATSKWIKTPGLLGKPTMPLMIIVMIGFCSDVSNFKLKGWSVVMTQMQIISGWQEAAVASSEMRRG